MVEEMKIIPREIRESKAPNPIEPLSEPYTGIVFVSPNGTKYFMTVSDDGQPIFTEVTV